MLLHLTPGRDSGRLNEYRVLSHGGGQSQPLVTVSKSVALRSVPRTNAMVKRPLPSTELYGLYTLSNEENRRGKRRLAKWPAKVIADFYFTIGRAKAAVALVEFAPNSPAGFENPTVSYLGFASPNQTFCELHAGGEIVNYQRPKEGEDRVIRFSQVP